MYPTRRAQARPRRVLGTAATERSDVVSAQVFQRPENRIVYGRSATQRRIDHDLQSRVVFDTTETASQRMSRTGALCAYTTGNRETKSSRRRTETLAGRMISSYDNSSNCGKGTGPRRPARATSARSTSRGRRWYRGLAGRALPVGSATRERIGKRRPAGPSRPRHGPCPLPRRWANRTHREAIAQPNPLSPGLRRSAAA